MVPPGFTLVPNQKLRTVNFFYHKGLTDNLVVLGYAAVSIKQHGQTLRGWRSPDGHFIPDRESKGYIWLVKCGALGPEWIAAARTLGEVDLEARRLRHGPDSCKPPAAPPGYDPQAWADTAARCYVTKALGGTLGVVHGTETQFGFAVDPDCPMADLWPGPVRGGCAP